MDINLGYIEGISRIDTPYFANITAQHNYFETHLVKTISTTFYPPHYRNSIRVDVMDIDLVTQCNYLWFEYGSKVYYYFIDDVEYINENLIELSITMDSIQTFMFNIKISNGVIERRFINRFIDNTINRGYIRENLSSGLFTYQETTLMGSNLWLVIKISELPHPNTNGYNVLTRLEINNRISYIPYGYLYLPLFCEHLNVITGYDEETSEPIYTLYDLHFNEILNILKSPYVIDAYVIDYNPRPDVFVINNRVLKVLDYVDKTPATPLLSYTTFLVRWSANSVILFESAGAGNSLISKAVSQSYTRDVSLYDSRLFRSKNTAINIGFNSRYITQLLDENYIRIEFGNGGGVASYPLATITLNSLKISQYSNIDDGSKIFTINSGDKGLYQGLDYQTYVLSNIKPSLALLNDAWESYQANNQGRWISAGIGAVKNAVTSFVGIPLKNNYINNRIKDILANPNKYDKRYKEPTLKDSYVRKLEELNARKQGLKGEIGTGIIDTVSPIINQGVSDINAQFVPDSIRMSGDFITSYLSSQYMTMYRHLEVNDIEQVANYYHRNGFKVDEYVNNIDNIFDYVKNRYYFNILKVSECNLHLHDYIESDNIINTVIDRLNTGLRLWNIDVISIGDFEYDNVELDYIND